MEEENLNEDEAEVLDSLEIRPSQEHKKGVVINLEKFKETLNKFKNKTGEVVSLENDLYGHRISLLSHKLPANKLLDLAHNSLSRLIKERKTLMPLGIG